MHPGVTCLMMVYHQESCTVDSYGYCPPGGALHHSQGFANWTVDECREWSGKAAHQSLLTIIVYTVALLARARTRVSAA